LNSDLLNKLYEDAKTKAEESEQRVRQFEENLQNSEQLGISIEEPALSEQQPPAA